MPMKVWKNHPQKWFTYRATVYRTGFTNMKHDFFLPLTFQRD